MPFFETITYKNMKAVTTLMIFVSITLAAILLGELIDTKYILIVLFAITITNQGTIIDILTEEDGDDPIDTWISVKDRTPDRNSLVVITDGEDVSIGNYYGKWGTPYTIDTDKITHWMPLPSAPNGKKP